MEPSHTGSAAAKGAHQYPHRYRCAGLVQANWSGLPDPDEQCTEGLCRERQAHARTMSQGPINTAPDDTREFRQHAIASILDDAPGMFGDLRVNKLVAMRLEALVGSSSSTPISRE